MIMDRINIRGIMFDNVTKSEAIELIKGRVAARLRTVVVTPNAEIAEACVEDEKLMHLINSADVVLPDGVGIIKASKILGTPLKEKVPGVEVGEALFSELTGHRFYLLGGKEGVAKAASERMKKLHGASFAGYHHGYFFNEEGGCDRVVEEIDSSGADVLIVCLGFPAQEKWIRENIARLPHVKLALALGGSIDVWSGNSSRAPKLFIKLGLEWLWRLIRQPSRIKRMAALPRFYIGTKRYKKEHKKTNYN